MDTSSEFTLLPCGRLPHVVRALQDGEPTNFGLDLGGRDPYDLLDEISQTARKDIIILKNWCWWDLDVDLNNAELEAKVRDRGLAWPPAVIHSDYINAINNMRFSEGDWVRTGLLVEVRDNALFETRNSIYVLTGSGTRKTIAPDISAALF